MPAIAYKQRMYCKLLSGLNSALFCLFSFAIKKHDATNVHPIIARFMVYWILFCSSLRSAGPRLTTRFVVASFEYHQPTRSAYFAA